MVFRRFYASLRWFSGSFLRFSGGFQAVFQVSQVGSSPFGLHLSDRARTVGPAAVFPNPRASIAKARELGLGTHGK